MSDFVLFRNGSILTMDPAQPLVNAVLARDGVVFATGQEPRLRALTAEPTVIDLGGATAIPGLVDAHNHLALNALAPHEVDCRTPPVTSMTALADRVRAAAEQLPPGRWLRGHGYDDALLGGHPTRALLDAAAPQNPVVLVHWSVHRAVVNSTALAAASLTAADGNPSRGWMPVTSDGYATGLTYEHATNPFQAASLRDYARTFRADLPRLVALAEADLLAQGITAIGDAYVPPELFSVYAPTSIRVAVQPFVGSPFGLFAEPWDGAIDAAAPGHRWTRTPGIKIFVDGGGNTTATSMRSGEPPRFQFYTQERLNALVAWAHGGSGVAQPIALHAAGDIAVTMALDAIEAAMHAEPNREPRFRIEHAITIKQTDIARIARLGVIVVTQPAALFFAGARLTAAALAPGVRIAPYRDLLDAGVQVAFSSDSPCYPVAPLWQMWCAVTRATQDGGALDDGQQVTSEEAIRAYTATGGAAIFAAGAHGTLAPGTRADLALLSINPLHATAAELRDATVTAVYIGGQRVPTSDRATSPGRPIPS